MESIAMGVSLALDCFSAAFGAGCSKGIGRGQALVMASSFGLFQAGMLSAGWAGGALAAELLEYNLPIAVALLMIAGAHMIFESFSGGGHELCGKRFAAALLALSIATSIDALTAGLSLRFLGLSLLPAAASAGLASFLLTLLGYRLGLGIGAIIGRRAGAVGGSALILLALKILLENLSPA